MKSKFPLRAQLKVVVVVLFLVNRATSAFGGAGLLIQRKIPKKLAEAFCSGDFTFQTMWLHGLYDAQVEGSLIMSNTGTKKLPMSIATERAREIAIQTKKNGYASGSCAQGMLWAAAFTSSEPLAIKNDWLDLSSHKSYCAGDVGVHWVAAQQGSSVKIPEVRNRYKLPKKDGYVSVVCSTENGPIEVFLAPVGKSKIGLPVGLAANNMDEAQQVLSWINAVRAREGKNAISLGAPLMESSKALSGAGAVTHDIRKINEESQRLKALHFNLLGEDRVHGKDLEEALTLLWISPLHRDLLLSGAATYAGLTILRENGVFLQITMGLKTP